MYHNNFAEVPGKLTVPRSKRTTSQLEGYHGAALNHVVRGYNTSAELAIPQLTLTNHAWNIDRLVSFVPDVVHSSSSSLHCLSSVAACVRGHRSVLPTATVFKQSYFQTLPQ